MVLVFNGESDGNTYFIKGNDRIKGTVETHSFSKGEGGTYQFLKGGKIGHTNF